MFTYAERLLLKKCMVLRRVQREVAVPLQTLMDALEGDQDLIASDRPDLYFNEGWSMDELHWFVRECVDEGLIDVRTGRGGNSYARTRLGEIFLDTLEPRLRQPLDEMPMSSKGLLDFQALS